MTSDRKRLHGDESGGESSDDNSDEEAQVGLALRKESALKSGQLQQEYSRIFTENEPKEVQRFTGHKNSVTCGCLSANGLELYTGAKDCSIIKWCLVKAERIWRIQGQKKKAKDRVCHKYQVNSIAVSDDSKFLVSAGNDNEIFIWNPLNGSLVTKLKGHQSSVISLAFKPHSYQLFSTSKDRFVKIWQVDDEVLLDNLCGHESTVNSVHVFYENPVTSGGIDKTIRLWKVAESSQLVFVHSEYVDFVLCLSRETFVSGDCAGALCIWSTKKKKPIFKQLDAHSPKWVASLATLPSSDILASGSSCGAVKLWKVIKYVKLQLIRSVPVTGFVNFILFTPDATKMILGISKENKLGRFEVIENCKKSVMVYQFTAAE